MAVIKFVVQLRSGRAVEVRIYDTQKAMREASKRWNGVAIPSGTEGVTQAWDGEVTRVQAIIRLNQQDLHQHVIDHEIVHAAQAIYGKDHETYILAHPLEHWTHHNEDFAYLFTEIQDLVLEGMSDNGLGK